MRRAATPSSSTPASTARTWDIAEQGVQTTISVTDRAYAHDYDKVVLRGTPLELDARDDIK